MKPLLTSKDAINARIALGMTTKDLGKALNLSTRMVGTLETRPIPPLYYLLSLECLLRRRAKSSGGYQRMTPEEHAARLATSAAAKRQARLTPEELAARRLETQEAMKKLRYEKRNRKVWDHLRQLDRECLMASPARIQAIGNAIEADMKLDDPRYLAWCDHVREHGRSPPVFTRPDLYGPEEIAQ